MVKIKMANNSFDLPEELMYEIFTYLPSKLVGKSRCLSKTWNNQLSTSQFIELHQTRKKTTETLVLLSKSDGYLHWVNPPVEYNNDVVWSPTPILQRGKWRRLFGSSNGLLLLLQRKTRKLFVVNPITRKHVQIIPSGLREKEDIILSGFGYDSVSRDYKIVTLSYERKDDFDYTNADVYSMKTRVWKTLDYDSFGDSFPSKMAMRFVNGALHWFTDMDVHPPEENTRRICAFDLATESFREVPLPKGLGGRFAFNGLVVLRGCLANVNVFPFGSVDVWVMNEYGVQDSWVQIRILENNIWSRVQPVCFVGEEGMLCVTGVNMQCWALYDLKEGTCKKGLGNKLVCGENPVSFGDWMVFEESLVSPE